MARIGRISLRRLMLLVAAVAVLLAWCSQGPWRQKRVVEYLRPRLVGIGYEDWEDDAEPPSTLRSWIASTLGRDFAFSVTVVRCDDAPLTDDECAMLSAFPRLKHLLLRHHTVTDASLKTIGSLKHLEFAGFWRCAITDDGLASLAGLRKLRALALLDTPVRGPGLAHFKACPGLETLDISTSKLVPEAFGLIATFSNLRELELDEVGATDNDVCQLQSLSRLQRLTLYGNPITDRSVEYVLRFPQLEVFSANETDLSAEAIARLKRLRPNLSVHWYPKGQAPKQP